MVIAKFQQHLFEKENKQTIREFDYQKAIDGEHVLLL